MLSIVIADGSSLCLFASSSRTESATRLRRPISEVIASTVVGDPDLFANILAATWNASTTDVFRPMLSVDCSMKLVRGSGAPLAFRAAYASPTTTRLEEKHAKR